MGNDMQGTCQGANDPHDILLDGRGGFVGVERDASLLCGMDMVPPDENRPRKMMIASRDVLEENRIDEWTSLADAESAKQASALVPSCSCLPNDGGKKIAKPGLRHFVADTPESDQIMVVDDGIPIWVDDQRDSLGRMKKTRAEGLGLKGMSHKDKRDKEEERQAMREIEEEMKRAGNGGAAGNLSSRLSNDGTRLDSDRGKIQRA